MRSITTSNPGIGVASAISLSGTFFLLSSFSLAPSQIPHYSSTSHVLELKQPGMFARASSLFMDSRSMSAAEQKAYNQDLKKIFRKTGRNLFS